MLQAVQARKGKRGWKKEQGHLKITQEEDCVCACPWVCMRAHVGVWAQACLAGAGRQGPWASLKVSQAKEHCP